MDKIVIAYSTRRVDVSPIDVSSFAPPSNYKDEAAIARWRAAKADALSDAYRLQPYTSTFEEVILYTGQDEPRFAYRPPDGKRQPACLAIRNWLLERYPKAWPNEIDGQISPPPVKFFAFNPRLFFKILGHECALPATVKAAGSPAKALLPLSLWMGSCNHYWDVDEVARSGFDGNLPWAEVLKRHELTIDYAQWTGPGASPDQDLSLAVDLLAHMGILAARSKAPATR